MLDDKQALRCLFIVALRSIYVEDDVSDLCWYWKQETVETKRKGSKNMFKSEKEFLEFMLKYQQVLSERDSGNRKSVKPGLPSLFYDLLFLYSSSLVFLLSYCSYNCPWQAWITL